MGELGGEIDDLQKQLHSNLIGVDIIRLLSSGRYRCIIHVHQSATSPTRAELGNNYSLKSKPRAASAGPRSRVVSSSADLRAAVKYGIT